MGNICGKTESEPSQPGRPLGSAPPPGPKTSRVPQKVGGPPRTLGGAGSSGSDVGGANTGDPSDARRKAAEAAEARAKASSKGGKLQSQLNSQKKQNRSSTLAEASKQERLIRAADQAALTNWD
ncbi:hypothetical protein GGI43DRAFT_321404 [Trichoderma evansii]